MLFLSLGVTEFNPSLYPCEEFRLKWIREYVEEFENRRDTANEEQIKKLHKDVEQFAPVPHLFWSLWSFLQTEHSHIDFDYLA